MKPKLLLEIAAFLIMAATIGAGDAAACQRPTKAAWIASADQARIAARDGAACAGAATTNADQTGVIRPQQKSPGGTHR
jgi:hypothetical protein